MKIFKRMKGVGLLLIVLPIISATAPINENAPTYPELFFQV